MWSQTSATTTVCDDEALEVNATSGQQTNATTSDGCTAGGTKILTMIITGMFAAAMVGYARFSCQAS